MIEVASKFIFDQLEFWIEYAANERARTADACQESSKNAGHPLPDGIFRGSKRKSHGSFKSGGQKLYPETFQRHGTPKQNKANAFALNR